MVDEDTTGHEAQDVDQHDGGQAGRPADDVAEDSQGHLVIRTDEAVTQSRRAQEARRPS